MQENNTQTAFKAFSIVVLVYSVIAVIVAVLVCAYAACFTDADSAHDALSRFGVVAVSGISASAVFAAGVMMLASALIDAFVCVFALKCESSPEKKSMCVKVCIVALVLSVIGIGVNVALGVPNLIESVSFVFEAIILAFAVTS